MHDAPLIRGTTQLRHSLPGGTHLLFQSYRIIRFEDVDDVSEWDPHVTRLVRLIAQKPPA